MLRNLQVIEGKNIDAMYMAHKELKQGQVVNKDYGKLKTKDVADKDKVIFFATKERVSEGIDTYGDPRSDYDVLYETIKKDEYVKLVKPLSGEKYATDMIEAASGLQAGDKLKVKSNGKLEKDTTGADAIAIYIGKYDDAGNELYEIEII